MSVPNRADHPNRKVNGVPVYNGKYELIGHLGAKPEYNPIGQTDLKATKSGASGAFKKMGFKTPIERAKARESRPGKPPLPGF